MRDDPVRIAIARRLEELDYSYAKLSRLLGRADTYIHQYLTMGKPAELDWKDRLTVRNELGIPMQTLGIELPMTLIPLLGEVQADVRLLDMLTAPFPMPPVEAPYAYYEMLTDALDQHPEQAMRPGDFMAVDCSKGLHDLHTQDVVVALLCERRENGADGALHGTLVAREFVAPNLLITNTTNKNSAHILNIDGPLPFQVLLIGKLAYSIRNALSGK